MAKQKIFRWSDFGSREEWAASEYILPENGNPQVVLYARAGSKIALAGMLRTTPRALLELSEIPPASAQHDEVANALDNHAEGTVLWRPLNWKIGEPFAVRGGMVTESVPRGHKTP